MIEWLFTEAWISQLNKIVINILSIWLWTVHLCIYVIAYDCSWSISFNLCTHILWCNFTSKTIGALKDSRQNLCMNNWTQNTNLVSIHKTSVSFNGSVEYWKLTYTHNKNLIYYFYVPFLLLFLQTEFKPAPNFL